MQAVSLIGQTIQISPRNQETGGNDLHTRIVLKEYFDNGIRFYEVLNPITNEKLSANAATYDALFLRAKQPFRNHFTKGDSCYNKSSIHFKIKN